MKFGTVSISLWLLILAPVFGGFNLRAEVFSCVTAQGKLFFADDPGKWPPGCRPQRSPDKTGSVGGLSIMPRVETGGARAASELLAEISAENTKRQENVEEWKSEAQSLVDEYRRTRTDLVRAGKASEKKEIRRDIRQIKNRRDTLIREVEAARLPFRERGAIVEILGALPPSD